MDYKWHERFLKLAKFVSTWSKDPSSQVGAVIVDQSKRIVGLGYNGLARGIDNEEEILNNRDLKIEQIIHGEINAILNSNKSCRNCILYVWPFMPCSRCASIIVQSDIVEVIAPFSDNERWTKSFKLARKIFKTANVRLDEVECQVDGSIIK